MSIYEIGLLGNFSSAEKEALIEAITSTIEPFGLAVGSDVGFRAAELIGERDPHAAFVAAYFGGADQEDVQVATELRARSLPVIPVTKHGTNFTTEIPSILHSTNGLRLRQEDAGMTELVSALLECVGLLRRQRRVFISYRRIESSLAALQLHDLLSSRGFDVFLDTHDIRPGDPFQDILWNRLCDSDVMVMLDTPTYFDSKWTRQEVGRARAKGIQVLRLIWPEHTPSKLTDLSETIYLDHGDLISSKGPIVDAAADRIALAVEELRSRSIAARYMAITGKLRADVGMIGATVEGIGAHRAISIKLLDDQIVWAYPIVGIPSADLFHDVAEKARKSDYQGIPILVYDHVGIRDVWINHLKWLDDNIQSVRAIKVSEAGWILAAWEH